MFYIFFGKFYFSVKILKVQMKTIDIFFNKNQM